MKWLKMSLFFCWYKIGFVYLIGKGNFLYKRIDLNCLIVWIF